MPSLSSLLIAISFSITFYRAESLITPSSTSRLVYCGSVSYQHAITTIPRLKHQSRPSNSRSLIKKNQHYGLRPHSTFLFSSISDGLFGGNEYDNDDDIDEFLEDESDHDNSNDDDARKWSSSDDDGNWNIGGTSSTFWGAFEDDAENDEDETNTEDDSDEDNDGEAFLDVLQSIAADEVEFMNSENERAYKAQEMAGWGFSSEAIEAALGVAIDSTLENEDNDILTDFQEVSKETEFVELNPEIDMATVESHTTVEWDHETNQPFRLQSVYVDEVTCIGCTMCATAAMSTFFMEDEHGRARVFQQWGDDDETIQIAIDTCPVDCIHYIPYEELMRLEIERREQNINFKARLVNQGSGGYAGSSGGGKAFTVAQQISSASGFVVDNSEFELEEERKLEARKRKRMMEEMKKSVDL
mmetsp:Transcript_7980/g.9331  ORF Transcript_7980/g.9331 Transcript_7980/m.9331 type:complete len:415 (+) Transcript_7980:537-1781(+)